MKNLQSINQTQPVLPKPWPPSTETLDRRDRQMILIGLMVPITMVVLNITVFGVGLPAIRDYFQIRADVVGWLVTAYTLPFMIAMPLYGRLGDELGKRRLFSIGITTFLFGTVITLVASDLRLFMLGRVIQGLGSAGVIPLCIAIIAYWFPSSERGKALGTWNSIGPVTRITSPFLAGLLIDYLGWHLIFVPVLLVGLVALWVVREKIPHRHGRAQQLKAQLEVLRTFDWGGVALLTLAVSMLAFYLSSPLITGVAALRDWRLLALTTAFFGTLIFWERRHPNPYVALNILANKTFSRVSFTAGVRMFAMSSIGFLLPLYLADIHMVSAAAIGIVLMIHAGSLLVTMRVGGQLADRCASRWPVTISMITQVGAMMGFVFLPATVPLWVVTALVVFQGVGSGLSLAPLHRASTEKIPAEQIGMAAGLYSMVRFAGTMLGPVIGGVVLQQGLDLSLQPIEAYQTVFWLMAVVSTVGVVAGLSLKD